MLLVLVPGLVFLPPYIGDYLLVLCCMLLLFYASLAATLNCLPTWKVILLTNSTIDFNILNWWHEHKLIYPILLILARDVMTVPVSTISKESAVSTTGRIIEERWQRLRPEMMEMLALVKDWELGDARLQHTVEDQELEDSFENLYLDEAEFCVIELWTS